jgi:competence protein ComEA
MLQKLLMVLVLSWLVQQGVHAVEVNQADVAALAAVKGIGPVLSEQIVAERHAGGDFKDWNDFEARVKGVANKKSVQLSKEGVTVGGKKRRGHYKSSDDAKNPIRAKDTASTAELSKPQ